MKFCPQCGQSLAAFGLEQKQMAVAQLQEPTKRKSWFERHLNWTMVLGLIASYGVDFIVLRVIVFSGPYFTYAQLLGIGVPVAVAILAPIWGWALIKKNRSLWWIPLGLFVPFGWIVLLCLENKSLTNSKSK